MDVFEMTGYILPDGTITFDKDEALEYDND